MRRIKRLFSLSIISILILVLLNTFFVKGALKPLVINNTNVKYRGSTINVMIPSEYSQPEEDFRGVWVSPIVGDIAKFASIAQYKAEITEVLDVMEHYNLNALIFHVRPFNDALYRSKLNPWSSYLRGYNIDPGWDPLPWIIEESHKRGIEFHAWLNPYRVKSYGVPISQTLDEFVAHEGIPSYNIASNPEYLLKTTRSDGTSGVILNPGEPAVRQFLIDTVMEIIENYDIDAIHFDDYFYANLGTNGSNIVAEVDQPTYLKYKPSYYNATSNTDKANWRREQVNTFICDLSTEMRKYNAENNRYVQLGISPTGIYKNGGSGFAEGGPSNYDANGNFITSGSNTAGQTHYSSYLFADSKKWVDEEWIDYIIPQTYWGFTHPVAGYADIVDWWAKVVRYKNVNLYTGMGIYMALESSNTYSWKNNELEAPMQVVYNTKHPDVKGTSIFSYKYIKDAYLKQSRSPYITKGLDKIKNELWNRPSLMPELKTYKPHFIKKIENLLVLANGLTNHLSWSVHPDATKYAIYRSNSPQFSSENLIAIIGNQMINNKVTYIDQVKDINESYYQIVPISKTNTLGEATIIQANSLNKNEIGEITNIQILGHVFHGQEFTLKFDKIAGKDDVKYSVLLSNDLTNWEVIGEQFIEETNTLLVKITTPTSAQPTYIMIKAMNNEGESIRVIQLEYTVIPELGRVKNTIFKGDLYPGLYLDFSWDEVTSEFYTDIEYEIEMSLDGKNYYKLPAEYIIKDNKVYQGIRLPYALKVYFRINSISPMYDEVTYGTPMVILLRRLTSEAIIKGIIYDLNTDITRLLS